MCRYLLLLLLLLALVAIRSASARSATSYAAFHRLVRFSSSSRRRYKYTSSRTNMEEGPAVPASSSHEKSSATALNAASRIKFKNLDDMLDSFPREPVLVYFSSANCGGCHLQKKELSALRIQMGDNALKILSIDTEKWPHVGKRFQIRSLPCLLVIKDKQVLLRLDGLTKADDLVEQMRSL